MAWIRPSFMDNMSWAMSEVYGAITDQILINLAHYFPYWKPGESVPKSSFEYQANMLAQMGQVNKDTIRIIVQGMSGADGALKSVLEQAIMESVKKSNPELLKGVMSGMLTPAGVPAVAPSQMRAFQLYYQQAAEKLNLVNTVMLESTRQAYQATVADIANRVQVTQSALNIGAGETVTGVSTWNQAVRHSIDRMKQGGIVGFIDHGGHRWSAEAYVSMDIRTTVANTARAAVWETNQDFGNDLYIVSYHDGARPKCYPWQNKVISSLDNARTVQDLDGNDITVIAQSSTSYGAPDGLFGINCKHYPSPFIPGVSVLYDDSNIPGEKENAEVYEQTQEQRRLERKLREEKRDILMAKAQGATAEQLEPLRERARQTSQDIDDFCDSTGLPRRRNREGVYTKREFPDPDTYDPATFERDQKDIIDRYFKTGGVQKDYSFGTMTPNGEITPPAPPVTPVAPVPSAQLPKSKAEIDEAQGKPQVIGAAESLGIEKKGVGFYSTQPTEEEIIAKIGGGDKTKGSCASVGLAYCGNKNGLDVTDFRGGKSQEYFSSPGTLRQIAMLDGVNGEISELGYDFTNAHKLLRKVETGKEYFFTAGSHAAIVKKADSVLQYLELQTQRNNGWHTLDDSALRYRFGCQRSRKTRWNVLIDVDNLKGNETFSKVLEFINTAADEQKKGVGGGAK